MVNLPKNFCIMPFIHMNIKLTNGITAACWRYRHNLGDYRENQLKDIWNGDGYKHIRQNFLDGKFNEGCGSCIDYESKGLVSTRTMCNDNFSANIGDMNQFIEKNLNTDLTMKTQPLSIEIRFGNLCNLRCLHCSSAFSSQWNTAVKYNKWLTDLNSQFKRVSLTKLPKSMIYELKSIINNVNHLNITGGEPLIHPDHLLFLNEIKEQAPHIHLEYNTNLNINLDILKKYIEIWKYFKKITLRVSLDADKKTYSYFRTNGNYKLIEQNIRYFKDNFDSTKYYLPVTITTNIYNITKIKNCFEEIKNNLKSTFHASLVQSPEAISIINLPYELKKIANVQLDEIFHSATNREKKFIEMIKNYLNSQNNDLTMFNMETINYILGMDKLNNTDYRILYPEFIPFMRAL